MAFTAEAGVIVLLEVCVAEIHCPKIKEKIFYIDQ